MTKAINPMLEKIARAMALANYPGGSQADIDEMWEGWLPEARAAVQALMEPTDEMSDAGSRQCAAYVRHEGTSDDIYRAMLQTILEEQA